MSDPRFKSVPLVPFVRLTALAAIGTLALGGCSDSGDKGLPENPERHHPQRRRDGPAAAHGHPVLLVRPRRAPADGALPYSGFLDTIPGDPEYAVTDSAAGATAWAIGKKVPNGTTGLGPDGEEVPTLMDIAKERGMSTGLVNDHDITNATLAAFGSPVPDRDLKVDIAEGYLDNGVDVMFGGGEKYWYPEGEPGKIPDKGEDDASEGESNLVAAGRGSTATNTPMTKRLSTGCPARRRLALVQDSAKRRSTEIEGYDYTTDPELRRAREAGLQGARHPRLQRQGLLPGHRERRPGLRRPRARRPEHDAGGRVGERDGQGHHRVPEGPSGGAADRHRRPRDRRHDDRERARRR